MNIERGGIRKDINAGQVSLEGELVAHGHIYPVRLLYPDRFPWVPAWVVPQDPDVRWSDHQYGAGGTLCLELRPDNWDPDATGADVLQSAYNLLDQENPLGKGEKQTVPSAHLVSDIQRYDWKQHPILISNACYARLQAGVHDGVTAIRWSAEDDVWPIMVADNADKARTEHPASFDLGTWRVTVKVLVTKNAAPKEVDGTREEFADAIGVSLEGIGTEEGVVFVCGTDELAAFHSPKNHGVYGAYVAFCNEQDKVPPSTGHRPYEAISEEGAPVVADDAAVAIASGHAARVAIDILDPEVSLGPNAWLLVGLKKEWIFGGHGHNWQLDVGGPTKAADGLKPDLQLTEFQKELLEGISGETNDTP